jgi:hypothetical protein
VTAAVWVTPENLAGIDAGYLMRSQRDHLAAVTHQTLAARRETLRPSIAIIGTSTLRHALLGDDAVSEELSAALEKPTHALHLSAPGLEIWELAQLVDAVGSTVEFVVMTISPMQLSRPPTRLAELVREARLGLPPQLLDLELHLAGLTPPWRSGFLLLDQYRFFSLRTLTFLQNLITGPVGFVTQYNPRVRGRRQDVGSRYIAERIAGFAENHAYGLSVLERVIARRREQGPFQLLVLETPWNPESVALQDPALLQDYSAAIRDFAARQGVHYRDLNAAAGLEAEDFHDWGHVRAEAARRRFTRTLAQEVAELTQAKEEDPG